MENEGGIIAQFGFEYQKAVFICILLNEIKLGKMILYESVDDISFEEYSDCNSLYNNVVDSNVTQCKTGGISIDTIEHVFCNWLVNTSQLKYVLYSEKLLSFDFDFKELRKKIIRKIIHYEIKSNSNKNSILYKLKCKYNCFTKFDDLRQIFKDIKNIHEKYEFINKSIELVKQESFNRFALLNCADISLDYAKKLRFDMFCDYIEKEIKSNIEDYQSTSIDYQQYFIIVSECVKNVNDKSYNYDYTTFKKGKRNLINTLMDSREAKLLKMIFSSDENIVNHLIYEVYYKDLRDFYVECNNKVVDNIENTAHEIYIEQIEFEPDLKQLFKNVTEININKSLLVNRSYNKGCYIFLSSDDAPNDYFIEWSGANEKE